jgi:alpha-maltose-1-phosphate synthase
MKLLFLSSLYPPMTKGGGELSTHYLAQGLTTRGHEVQVIAEGTTKERTTVDGVAVHRVPLPLTAKPLLEQRHARKMAAALKAEVGDLAHYDVIHAHDFRTAQILSELDVPHAVVTARDYAQICGTTNNMLASGMPGDCCRWSTIFTNNTRVVEASLLRKPFRVWQYKYNLSYRLSSFRKFKHQIFISHAQQKEIAKKQNLDGIHTAVIYNPVSSDYLNQPLASGNLKSVLYVGTVEFYKGVELLLHAWQELIREIPDLKLTIVGDGAQRIYYEEFIKQNGLAENVMFTGRVAWDALRTHYDEAGVIVAPHLWIEPFGRTVVEAMARGKVVVAANVGGPAEILKDNETGLLFERGSVEALITRLRQVLTMEVSRKEHIQLSAHAWAKNNLTIDTIAQQYENFYTSLQ